MWLPSCLGMGCHVLLQLMSVVVNKNWTDLARHGNLENWREILAALVTYAGPEDFASLCGRFPW